MVIYSDLFKGRQARHLPRAPFATVLCKVAYLTFKWGPTATAMYKWATLLSKGPQQQLQCENTLLSKATKITVLHFSFKGPSSLISSTSYFNLGIEAFSGVLGGDGTGSFGPL